MRNDSVPTLSLFQFLLRGEKNPDVDVHCLRLGRQAEAERFGFPFAVTGMLSRKTKLAGTMWSGSWRSSRSRRS